MTFLSSSRVLQIRELGAGGYDVIAVLRDPRVVKSKVDHNRAT